MTLDSLLDFLPDFVFGGGVEWRSARVILGAGLGVVLGVVAEQLIAARMWRHRLVALRLRFPRSLAADEVSACLGMLSAATRRRPCVFETVSSARGVGHYVLAPRECVEDVTGHLRAGLPGVRLEEVDEHLDQRPPVRAASELRLTSTVWPLATDRAPAGVSGVLGALYPLGLDEQVWAQWTVTGTRTRRPRRKDEDRDTEARRAVLDKNACPVFHGVGRVGACARYRPRARHLVSRVVLAMKVMDSPGARVVSWRGLPWRLVAGRLWRRSPPLAWPSLINAAELAGLVAIPTEDTAPAGVALGSARQVAPSPAVPRGPLVVAHSTYPGMETRPLGLRPDDRLRHCLVQGPTGTGKSTLICNMAVQDITAGFGTIVIDPKADLVEDVLSRVPKDRLDDVIVMDASKIRHPAGFNILATSGDEIGQEIVVDQIGTILAQLWSSSWGPRTADVVRNCLLTLIHSRPPNGGRFTIVEMPQLLTNQTFRRYVVAQTGIPEDVRHFWHGYENMSESRRAEMIGPAMNKLRQLVTRTTLRLMLGQEDGVDLSGVFTDRKILLVPLSQGAIGSDTAQLLGSLLVTAIWHQTLSRAGIPKHHRRPVFAYLDEFQQFVRFGSGDQLADMLAQARGLGLGLTLAHQYMDQLPPAVAGAVLGTARTQVCFQTEYGDAHQLARRFAPVLDENDLMGLEAWEVAMRPCVKGATVAPVTGRTPAPAEPLRDPREIPVTVGRDRASVEDAIRARTRVRLQPSTFGQRRDHEGEAT